MPPAWGLSPIRALLLGEALAGSQGTGQFKLAGHHSRPASVPERVGSPATARSRAASSHALHKDLAADLFIKGCDFGHADLQPTTTRLTIATMADIEQKYDLDHNDGTTSPTKLDYSHGVSHRILHK